MAGVKEFMVINSFAEKAFGGNPAAVYLDGEGLAKTVMQAIARQMNLVETVFVFRPGAKEKDLRFRYFHPHRGVARGGPPHDRGGSRPH